MSKAVKMKVSKRDGPSFMVMFEEPENLEDPRWNVLVEDPSKDINTLAVQAVRVKVQAVVREELDKGEEAVQKAVNEYTYKSVRAGGKRAAPKLSKESAKKGKFSEAQLVMLKEAGFDIEGDAPQEA